MFNHATGIGVMADHGGKRVSQRKGVDGKVIETWRVRLFDGDVLMTWGNYPDPKWTAVVDRA